MRRALGAPAFAPQGRPARRLSREARSGYFFSTFLPASGFASLATVTFDATFLPLTTV